MISCQLSKSKKKEGAPAFGMWKTKTDFNDTTEQQQQIQKHSDFLLIKTVYMEMKNDHNSYGLWMAKHQQRTTV